MYLVGVSVNTQPVAVHLALLGYLIYRSGYLPKVIGVLLVIDGVCWVINPLKPYLYPNAHLGYLFVFSFSELLLPLWLVIRGWELGEQPRARGESAIAFA